MQTLHAKFLALFNTLPAVAFNPEWKNGTGYLDFVCEDEELNLELGQMVSCIDDYNRKMIIQGLGNGLNATVFERGVDDVLVSNQPSMRLSKKLSIKRLYKFDGQIDNVKFDHFVNFKDYVPCHHIISSEGREWLLANIHPHETSEEMIDKIKYEAFLTGIASEELESININIEDLHSKGFILDTI